MTKSIRDTLSELAANVELSKALGVPIGDIPEKALDVIRLLMPHLVENTKPREAAIIMAVVYLFFSALLTGDISEDFEHIHVDATDLETAKDLLDVALDIFSRAIQSDTPDTDTK
jgi:hypothetical protein